MKDIAHLVLLPSSLVLRPPHLKIFGSLSTNIPERQDKESTLKSAREKHTETRVRATVLQKGNTLLRALVLSFTLSPALSPQILEISMIERGSREPCRDWEPAVERMGRAEVKHSITSPSSECVLLKNSFTYRIIRGHFEVSNKGSSRPAPLPSGLSPTSMAGGCPLVSRQCPRCLVGSLSARQGLRHLSPVGRCCRVCIFRRGKQNVRRLNPGQ